MHMVAKKFSDTRNELFAVNNLSQKSSIHMLSENFDQNNQTSAQL